MLEEILPDEWTKVEADVARMREAFEESHPEARAIFLGEVAGPAEVWVRPLRLAA